jgi:hypothetical protein
MRRALLALALLVGPVAAQSPPARPGAPEDDLPSQITRLTWFGERASWSPDGTRIAFTSGYDLASSGHYPWLMVTRADGGRASRLTRLTGIHDPAWSPISVR